MKKTITKILSIISYLLALMLLLPTAFLSSALKGIDTYRIYLIPYILIFISIVSFVICLVDKDKEDNSFNILSYHSILYGTLFSSISGLIYYALTNERFSINAYDFLGFAQRSLNIYPFYVGILVNAFIIICTALLLIFSRKNSEKKLINTIVTFVVSLILFVLSTKGIYEWYDEIPTVAESFKYGSLITDYKVNTLFKVFEIISLNLSIALYVLLFIIFIKKNKKTEEPIEENQEPTVEIEHVDETIDSIADKNMLKYSDAKYTSNLDFLYSYEFGFENVVMKYDEFKSDYYVNGVKFLTLSNDLKYVSFNYESTKAIGLIIMHPEISKEKFEDSKLWFRINDTSNTSKDVIIDIIKETYRINNNK